MMYVLVSLFVGVVAVGMILVYLVPRLTYGRISLLIIFTAAYIFSTTVVHLLPEVFSVPSRRAYLALVLLLGFLLQHFLSQLTMGIEHGHSRKMTGNTLPLKLLSALYLHAFLEGLIGLHRSNLHETLTVNVLLLGVLLHKLPAAIALTFVLRSYYGSRKKYVLVWVGGFAFSTPLGMLFGYFISVCLPELGWINSLVLPLLGGMFLHIAMAMFFEVAPKHIYGWRKNLVLILGVGIGIFMEYAMHFLSL